MYWKSVTAHLNAQIRGWCVIVMILTHRAVCDTKIMKNFIAYLKNHQPALRNYNNKDTHYFIHKGDINGLGKWRVPVAMF